jgi:phospholipid/cholesterol/gamma-HCH transport system substrate-binding protein
MKRRQSMELKVGIFFSLALIGLMVTILTLSSQSGLFKQTHRMETGFSNIAGLTVGAPVLLSGVQVGYVERIRFDAQDVDTARVLVSFSVDEEGRLRITKDSVTTIDSSGLLGKKFLEVAPGDPKTGFVEPGAYLEGIDPTDFIAELEKAGALLESLRSLSNSIRDVVESVKGEGPPTDLSRAITALKDTIEGFTKGPGMAHALIFDPAGRQMIHDLAATTRDLKLIVADFREGEGVLPALIYDPEGKELVNGLSRAATSLDSILLEVKEGSGTVHGLIYGEEGKNLIEELTVAAANLREITDTIRQGDGTVGGLVMDPTIYEDIKKITGGVERNDALKCVVRYAIHRYEAKREKKKEEQI